MTNRHIPGTFVKIVTDKLSQFKEGEVVFVVSENRVLVTVEKTNYPVGTEPLKHSILKYMAAPMNSEEMKTWIEMTP